MRQSFIDWLPEDQYYRFIMKQVIILVNALLFKLFLQIPFLQGLLVIGSLLLIFRFFLNPPLPEKADTKRRSKRQSVPVLPDANPHGLLNHALVVAMFPIALSFTLSFFI